MMTTANRVVRRFLQAGATVKWKPGMAVYERLTNTKAIVTWKGDWSDQKTFEASSKAKFKTELEAFCKQHGATEVKEVRT
jgi:hypothetical protein